MESNEVNIFAQFESAESGLNPNQDCGSEAHADSVVTTVESSDIPPRPLWNGRKAAYVLGAERPEHRAICLMKASAMTNKEIASAIGWSAPGVANVVKQPWAQEQILREIENAGREPVVQLLRISAQEATETILDTMRTADSKKVRMEAAIHVLDRVLGKATNKIEVSNKSASEFSDAELAAIAAQGKKN